MLCQWICQWNWGILTSTLPCNLIYCHLVDAWGVCLSTFDYTSIIFMFAFTLHACFKWTWPFLHNSLACYHWVFLIHDIHLPNFLNAFTCFDLQLFLAFNKSETIRRSIHLFICFSIIHRFLVKINYKYCGVCASEIVWFFNFALFLQRGYDH